MTPATIHLTILGKPRSKKNSVRIARRHDGRPFVRPSATAQAWVADAKRQIRAQYRGPTLHGPVAVTYAFHLVNRQHEADLGNYVNAVDDALEAAGVLANDRQIVLSTASKHVGAAEARTELTVYAVAELAA